MGRCAGGMCLGLLLCLLAACAGTQKTASGPLEPPTATGLFPMNEGGAWSYDARSRDGQNVLAITRVISRVGNRAEITTGQGVLTYEQRPEITQFIMDVAEVNQKGMVAIRPFGGVAETPVEMVERCQEHIEWNNREIADALLRQARGEDTARWEVLDFPGFDADGPTD